MFRRILIFVFLAAGVAVTSWAMKTPHSDASSTSTSSWSFVTTAAPSLETVKLKVEEMTRSHFYFKLFKFLHIKRLHFLHEIFQFCHIT